jgi:hypothetical protein
MSQNNKEHRIHNREKKLVSLYWYTTMHVQQNIKLKRCNFRLSPRCKLYFTLFWGLTQHKVAILYWRFGTTYRYSIQGSRGLGILDPCTAQISKWSRVTLKTKRRTIFFIPNGTEIRSRNCRSDSAECILNRLHGFRSCVGLLAVW